jgi:putative transposase
MANHIHLIAIPRTEASLAKGIGEAHRRYTRMVNFREGWRGFLFQGRFFSCPLENAYLLAAIRYVLRNPVRAGIVRKPWKYPWSSARWLVGDVDNDPPAMDSPLLEEVEDWKPLLVSDSASAVIRGTHTLFPEGAS